MLRNKFCDIFHKVQQSSSCHQKYREILRNLYNEVPFEDFEIEFMRCIELLFWQDVTHKNMHVERSLEFAATFVGSLIVCAENSAETGTDCGSEDDDVQTHPFLNAVIRNALEYHNLENISARYRTCQLIDLILRNAGDDAHIENDLWNVILDSLLDRIKDAKPVVRLQAVRALARLQSPIDSECPVIHAFLGRMYDCSAMVRKEIVELIAPTPVTSSKIVEKVRDCDHNVRLAAYRKCSKMGPKMVKLIDRQSVVFNGFNEMHEGVKLCFLEDTLPKWLSAYNGDFLKLLHALKVDAYAEDLEKTEVVCKKVLEVFFKTHQLTAIIEYLPINENKVIPLEKLNYESALYWSILVNYLRKSDDTEEYLDSVIPELLPFCAYIRSIVKENAKLNEGYMYNEYQYVLGQLLHIAGKYDLGDELSRKKLHELIIETLTAVKLDSRNITEMIAILDQMNPVLDSLTIDICSIISDIREPLVEQQLSEDAMCQNNFKLAGMRVKINILAEEKVEAVGKCDYERAAVVKKQLADLNKKMEEMISEFDSAKTMIRASQNDPDTLCRCLNIFIGILSHPKLKTLTVSLRSCKDEFVVPLCDNNHPEINWRVYKCIALCCTLDRQLAQESLKLLCSPIIFYRLTLHHEYAKQVLLICIATVSDILRLYGTDIFDFNDGHSESSNNTIRRRLNGTKRLYRTEQMEDSESVDFDSITWKDIIDILLDMLDDEYGDIREQACRAICELVIAGIAISSDLFARLILKWFNPLTEKHDQKLQLLLGNTFVRFAQMPGAEEVLEQAVIPVLSQIGNAPASSPLADVDLDNALRFLSAITSVQKQAGLTEPHKNLAQSLCNKITDRPEDKCVPIYIKMLLNLELFVEDTVIVKELINQAELILRDVVDKGPKRNVQKFLFKLNQLLAEKTAEEGHETGVDAESAVTMETASRQSISVNNSTQTEFEETENENRNSNMPNPVEQAEPAQTKNGRNSSIHKRNSDPLQTKNNDVEKSLRQTTSRLSSVSLNEKPPNSPVKRRKRRGRRSKEASIANDNMEETILHTIIENDEIEMGSLQDDSLTIRTPSMSGSQSNNRSSSGSSGKRGRPKKVIISDTSSDSESTVKRRGRSKDVLSETSSDSDVTQKKTIRRSLRKRKSTLLH